MAAKNVALVAGLTGITGEALVEILSKLDTTSGLWKVYGIARRPKPEWHTPDVYVKCDLTHREKTLAKVSQMKDVTHIFWVTWVERWFEEDNYEDSWKMFQNLLDALLPNTKSLQHVCLQTGGKHYVGRFNQLVLLDDGYELSYAPFTEDLPRLSGLNLY